MLFSTGFCGVLPGFAGFCGVFPGFPGFSRVLPGFVFETLDRADKTSGFSSSHLSLSGCLALQVTTGKLTRCKLAVPSLWPSS